MPSSPMLSPVEEQAKLLDEAVGVVKVQAFQMKRCLDKNRVLDALKHASAMLGELRTSLLSPKNYYQLYITITDELRHLEMCLHDEFQRGREVRDLYEMVQYAGNIVPRLYLLITVGLVYIKKNPSLRKDILKDLVEMCRGVQHPLRGLFLRSYLLQCTRNVLPDVPEGSSDEEAEGGCVRDSIDFVLMNFAEMNKLWVRMQHQGHSRDRERREREREELRILVGTNLVRLSQLESVTLEDYRRLVLPGLLEQVVSCKDAIAQEYLMECVIQVFPDEFHLHTLRPFLESCAELSVGVNVKNVVALLLDRLGTYAQREGASLEGRLFEELTDRVAEVASARTDLPSEDAVSLQGSLLHLALRCYPDRMDYVDEVLSRTLHALPEVVIHNSSLGRELDRTLRVPVDHKDLPTVLELRHYAPLCSRLDVSGQRALALHLVQNALEHSTFLDTEEKVEAALGGPLKALVSGPLPDDPDEVQDEQGLLARFLHQLVVSDPDQHLKVLKCAYNILENGGSQRLKHTIPPLVFQAFSLLIRFWDIKENFPRFDEKCREIIQWCREAIALVAKAEYPELALRLYLQGCLVIDRVACEEQETAAYDFVSQAFSLYEDEVSESRAQLAALTLIIGTLEKMICFGPNDQATLMKQCALATGKLLKKPDQCRAAGLCAHLFWAKGQPKETLKCLSKATKIAGQVMDASVQVQLLVELADRYVHFHSLERIAGPIEKPVFPADTVTAFTDQVKTKLANLEASEESRQITVHLNNTLTNLSRVLEMEDM